MSVKTVLTAFFYCIIVLPCAAQNNIFVEAFNEFASSRLWEYEPIQTEWKMGGMLQADFNEGVNSLLENNPMQAEASLTAVIKKDSSLWQAYYYRSAARKQLRHLGSAEQDLHRVLKLRDDFYEGYVELAKILYLQHKSFESERAINKAIRIDKSRGAAYYLKGDINMSQNQSKSAINNYKDCLAADSLFHNARIKLALLDIASKADVTTALNHLNKVLSYDSLQKSALLFRSILGYEKDKKQSVRDLSNLILVSPDNLMAYFYRGLYLTELENYDQAFLDFHKVIKATSTDDNNFKGQQSWLDKKIDLQNAGAYVITRVYGLPEEDGSKIKQAYCHILTAAYDKSLASVDQTSKPKDEPLAVYLKAVAYEHKGEHNKALSFYNRALELDNEIEDARKKRGIYLQELKQWDKSISDLTVVLRLNPNAYITNRIRGVSYYHNNQFTQAIADFNTYLKHDSTNKEVIGFRGMAYLDSNQKLKAYLDFAMSGNQHALNFKDIHHLIDSVLALKDTLQALYSLDKITAATPYFTEGYVQKFKICVARNNWKPIEKDILHALRNTRSDTGKPQQSYLLTLQAVVHSRNRHQADALDTFDQAIKFDKKNAFAYRERGRLLLAMGKASKAEKDLTMAFSLGDKQAKQLLSTVSTQ
jgi:tetratricopeptide (TPR) repeat protein